ncbi:MAG TPA: hypothetical protein VHH88_13875 [Verrucomicrobiae bacterium]|nr:hypothetical protein [Verrucomicrobiae bacterium]
MKQFLTFLIIAAVAASAWNSRAQGHYHLYVAADTTAQNGKLYFDDSALTPADTFVSTLNYTNSGTYAGYYQPGYLTIAVLAQTPAHGGPDQGAPALGSWIFIRVVSVDGPAGGEFSFWDVGAANPTFVVPCGTTAGTNSYRASENDGSAGTDPYGHIHGRAFAANKPGLYTIGFQAFDNSTNGAGGGPIQSPSDIYYFRWQAGVIIKSLDASGGAATATFGATGGKNFSLQYTGNPASGQWQSADGVVSGDDHFQTLTDPAATNSARFYRIVVMPAD